MLLVLAPFSFSPVCIAAVFSFLPFVVQIYFYISILLPSLFIPPLELLLTFKYFLRQLYLTILIRIFGFNKNTKTPFFDHLNVC